MKEDAGWAGNDMTGKPFDQQSTLIRDKELLKLALLSDRGLQMTQNKN